jgi:hypothetical protein
MERLTSLLKLVDAVCLYGQVIILIGGAIMCCIGPTAVTAVAADTAQPSADEVRLEGLRESGHIQ